MTDTFDCRVRQHNNIAIPIITDLFDQYGFEGHNIGLENNKAEVKKALQGKRDQASLMFRYRPDMMFMNPSIPSLMVEVKSEEGKSKNWAVEFDSYCASKSWDEIHKTVMYIFVEIGGTFQSKIQCCWARRIPLPKAVRIPKRPDWETSVEYIQNNYPDIFLSLVNWKGGSGTPYFLIKKTERFLVPFHQFIKKEVLKEKEPEQLSMF